MSACSCTPSRIRSSRTGPVLSKALGVLVPEGGALAAQEEIELADLHEQRLVLFARASAPETYDDLLANCRVYGYVPARSKRRSGGSSASVWSWPGTPWR